MILSCEWKGGRRREEDGERREGGEALRSVRDLVILVRAEGGMKVERMEDKG